MIAAAAFASGWWISESSARAMGSIEGRPEVQFLLRTSHTETDSSMVFVSSDPPFSGTIHLRILWQVREGAPWHEVVDVDRPVTPADFHVEGDLAQIVLSKRLDCSGVYWAEGYVSLGAHNVPASGESIQADRVRDCEASGP